MKWHSIARADVYIPNTRDIPDFWGHASAGPVNGIDLEEINPNSGNGHGDGCGDQRYGYGTACVHLTGDGKGRGRLVPGWQDEVNYPRTVVFPLPMPGLEEV